MVSLKPFRRLNGVFMSDGSWGNVASGVGDLFGSIFGSQDYTNPADAANPYYNKIPGEMAPFYSPYMQYGQGAMGNLYGQYNQQLNDPTRQMNQISNNWQIPVNTMNQIGSTYHSSPGYGFNVQQSTNAANQAAAAGGMVGSPQEQQQLATTVSGLANQDYQQYLGSALGQFNNYANQGMQNYQNGLQGMQGINQMGYGAATDYAGNLANSSMNQGNLNYTGQQNQNQHNSNSWGSMFGDAGNIINNIPW